MDEVRTERDLLGASMRGDVRAFGRLVELHHAAVTAVAFAITRDLHLAEDIAQETFVAAWQQLADLRDPDRLRSWLCGIARNRSKNELRRRDREGPQPDLSVADSGPSPADDVARRETDEAVRQALAGLPEAYREPIVLYYWEDHSIEKVASALQISEQAAQKRLSRAREYMREELAEKLQSVGSARRSAKVAAAATVAVLARLDSGPAAGAASAGPARAGSARVVGAGIAFSAVAVAIVVGGLVFKTRGGSGGEGQGPGEQLEASAAIKPQRGAQSGGTHRPALGSSSQADEGEGPPLPAGGFGVPLSYEVTVLADTSVAVNLAGGRADLRLWEQPEAPTFSRHVRGRVVDSTGKGVGGAVVVVADVLSTSFGSLSAHQGSISVGDGAFDVVVHERAAMVAMALHPRVGWSQPVAVREGSEDVEVEIRVPRHGGMRGRVHRANAPVLAEVFVTNESKSLRLHFETDAAGGFLLPLLAPGSYRVNAWVKQLFAGGMSDTTAREVVVESGKTATVDFALAPGALIVASYKGPSGAGLSYAQYYLVIGRREGLDAAALNGLVDAAQAETYLLGGQDADRAMQFHDVAPGPHTICAHARTDGQVDLPVRCQHVDVVPGESVMEIELKSP